PGLVVDWKMMTIAPKLPTEPRIALIQMIENDVLLMSVGGWHGVQPPMDDAGYVAFTRDLAQPHIYEVMKHAEPLGPIHVLRYSHNQRRHYERMPRFPEGLAPVGDAFCSFNPIYGQGMTTGALQAQALGECVRQGLAGASQRYRRQVGDILATPWSMATTGDLRFPHVEGKRPPAFALTNWYTDRFQELACHDEEALRTFVRVMQMVDEPTALFSPRMVLKVLTAKPTTAALERKPEPPFAPAATVKEQAA
ncbi:MAG TPA: hypothetical protein VEU33_21395, partial [Archangium sp.]|nr:hypothetical protein [Archangium sp.]